MLRPRPGAHRAPTYAKPVELLSKELHAVSDFFATSSHKDDTQKPRVSFEPPPKLEYISTLSLRVRHVARRYGARRATAGYI